MKSLSNIGANAPASRDWLVLRGAAPDQIGDELKVMFGALTAGPLPDRMVQLADQLEEAFRRGELFETGPRRNS